MLKNIAYIFLILFFIAGLVVAFVLVTAVRSTDRALVQPIGDLVQSLVIPATPVILPSPNTIVNEINDLSRLETATIELEKIVTAERNNDLLWGALGESLIFVANGKIVAGVDFAEMETDDVQVVDPVTVMVHLPAAKIFDDLPVLDNDQSYVADRDTGLFASADAQLETKVRQAAEDALLEEAYASPLLERANVNAQQFMLSFLQGLGFENVIFTAEKPPVPEPFVQEVPKAYSLATPTPTP